MKVDPLDADATMADVNAAAATLHRFSGVQRRAAPGCGADLHLHLHGRGGFTAGRHQHRHRRQLPAAAGGVRARSRQRRLLTRTPHGGLYRPAGPSLMWVDWMGEGGCDLAQNREVQNRSSSRTSTQP